MICPKMIQWRLCAIIRSKLGSWVEGSVTEADNQSSFHCAVTLMGVMPDCTRSTVHGGNQRCVDCWHWWGWWRWWWRWWWLLKQNICNVSQLTNIKHGNHSSGSIKFYDIPLTLYGTPTQAAVTHVKFNSVINHQCTACSQWLSGLHHCW